MKLIKGYSVLTYILLPLTILLGIFTLFMLLAALINPIILLPVFISAGVVIYMFCCFIFLIKGLLPNKPCKPSLRDWIKVNSFLSMAFCAYIIYQAVNFFFNPEVVKSLNKMEIPKGPDGKEYLSQEQMKSIVKGAFYSLVFYATLLITHISITFRFLNTRNDLFDGNSVIE